MNIQEIETAATAELNSTRIIHRCNKVIMALAVVGIPFSMGGSLFALLAIPFNSALAAITTNTYRQKELTKLHLLALVNSDN